MSRIFELFGFPLDSWNDEAKRNLSKAWCPFMDAECDGGGNRYLSALSLSEHSQLAAFFPGKKIVQAGVCSLSIKEGEQPWIVCPRRLFSMRANSKMTNQQHIKNAIIQHSGLSGGQGLRVWSEVKMKVETVSEEEEAKNFDYTFDYIVCGQQSKRLDEVAKIVEKTPRATQTIAEANGYTIAKRSELWVENFPSDPVLIVEIMTSSTSGGDKKKRTQIGMAFEDAVLHPEKHSGPGINYRQVWARMVSQLIVKSQVGLSWGGRTIWLLQDVLANYISSSTALDLSKFIATLPDEVNILAFGYGKTLDPKSRNKAIIDLPEKQFYSGPISPGSSEAGNRKGFVDIVELGAPPPKDHLWKSLFLKKSCATFPMKG